MGQELTESQKQRIFNINLVENTVGTIGFIGGIIYANRTGGKFWRYIGYGILGGLVFRLPAYVISTPFKNKILKESESNPVVDNLVLNAKQDTVVANGGDASSTDKIGQQYVLTTPYRAMNTNTFKDVDFLGNTKFIKRLDRNGTNMNAQNAIKVFPLNSNSEQYVIPVAILKKVDSPTSQINQSNQPSLDSKKITTIKRMYPTFLLNPPKSEQEAITILSKYGLTKADIEAYYQLPLGYDKEQRLQQIVTEFDSNPPKSKQESIQRLKNVGLTALDLDVYLAQSWKRQK